MSPDGLLRRAQARVVKANAAADAARAYRDGLVCRMRGAGTSYRQIADTTGLSVAAVHKIVKAGPVRQTQREDTTTP